jgi:hypothetical protein
MKRLFIVTLAVLFVAGAAYAGVPTMDFTGMFYVRGSYISNDSGQEEDAGNYMYYDQELDADWKISAADKTFVFVNFEAHDQNWMAGNTDGTTQDGTSDLDDNLEIKRLYGSHTFAFGTAFDFGLMTGGAWATGFGDNSNGRWRLKFVHPLASGLPLIGVIEKNAEMGMMYNSPGYTAGGIDLPADAEADDYDAYYFATVAKVGDIFIKPLIGYIQAGHIELDEETDQTVSLLLLGVDGNLGMFAFESEFNYLNYAFSTDIPTSEDYNKYGVYFKGWVNLDAFKVGALGAYGSYDKDGGITGSGAGFGFGEDFTPTVFGADWAGFGSTGLSEYFAVTMFQLFGEWAMNEDISFNASYTNVSSNEKDTMWEDATGYEIDAGMSWSITDVVSYTIALGTGKWDVDGADFDSFTRAYHMIKINF